MPRYMPQSAALVAALTLAGLMTACSHPVDTDVAAGGFTDGTYTGRSQADDNGEYGEIKLTIGGGDDITAATFQLYEKSGHVKDTEYGKVNGQIMDVNAYHRAQEGIVAAPKYAAQLVSTDDLAKVDVISGATLSYQQFEEAVQDALRDAHR